MKKKKNVEAEIDIMEEIIFHRASSESIALAAAKQLVKLRTVRDRIGEYEKLVRREADRIFEEAIHSPGTLEEAVAVIWWRWSDPRKEEMSVDVRDLLVEKLEKEESK